MEIDVTDQFVKSNSKRICVIAGPGTGKSYSLKKRIKRLLIEKDIKPEKILALTFTNLSAKDLKKAMGEIEGIDDDILNKLEVSTLHSLALKILFEKNKQKHLMQDFEIKTMLRDLEPDIGKCRKKEQLFKSCRIKGNSSLFTKEELDFVKSRDQWLEQHKAFILDDIIKEANEWLTDKDNSETKGRWSYSQVLVDEYQDLNPAEQKFVNLLTADDGTLSVIGDDDQSIYEFKGASRDGILEFAEQENCEYISFSKCRRCPPFVVELANNLIKHNSKRIEKELVEHEIKEGRIKLNNCQTPTEEIEKLCEIIKHEYDEHKNILYDEEFNWDKIVVLAPTKKRGRDMFEALKKANIPVAFCFRGAAVTNDRIKERYALLSLTVNPEDPVSWRYLLGFRNCECYAKSYKHIRRYAEDKGYEDKGYDILTALKCYETDNPGNRYTRVFMERCQEIEKDLAEIRKNPYKLLEKLEQENPEDAQFYDTLKRAIDSNSGDDVFRKIFRDVREEIYSPEGTTKSDRVRIMSLHAAKGLSAGMVVIMSAVDGQIPLRSPNKTIEEERRLFYVAITRCKGSKEDENNYIGKLVISYYKTNDKDKTYKMTPFLKEMGLHCAQ